MNVKAIPVSAFQTNCYVAWDQGPAALVIDPGDDSSDILSFLKETDLSVGAYLLTHGHMDHVSAVADLYATMPAPVAIHPLDLEWAFSDQGRILPFFSTPRKPAEVERVLEPGQEWTDAGCHYQVLHTPGHTPGSVSFYFPGAKALFPGDVLFAGSVGRTDLPGGDSRVLQESLRQIAALPDDVTVYPGHGPATTIGEEKATNFFMRGT